MLVTRRAERVTRQAYISLTFDVGQKMKSAYLILFLALASTVFSKTSPADQKLLTRLAFEESLKHESQRESQVAHWFLSEDYTNSEKEHDPSDDMLRLLQIKFPKAKPASQAIISKRLAGVYYRKNLEEGRFFSIRKIDEIGDEVSIEVYECEKGCDEANEIKYKKVGDEWKFISFKNLWCTN